MFIYIISQFYYESLTTLYYSIIIMFTNIVNYRGLIYYPFLKEFTCSRPDVDQFVECRSHNPLRDKTYIKYQMWMVRWSVRCRCDGRYTLVVSLRKLVYATIGWIVGAFNCVVSVRVDGWVGNRYADWSVYRSVGGSMLWQWVVSRLVGVWVDRQVTCSSLATVFVDKQVGSLIYSGLCSGR